MSVFFMVSSKGRYRQTRPMSIKTESDRSNSWCFGGIRFTNSSADRFYRGCVLSVQGLPASKWMWLGRALLKEERSFWNAGG